MSQQGTAPIFPTDASLFGESVGLPVNNSGRINITSIILGLIVIVFFLWLLNSWALTKKVKKSTPNYKY